MDGFLVSIDTGPVLVDRSAELRRAAELHLGPDVRIQRAGPLTVAMTGKTDSLSTRGGLRIGHGSAARRLDGAMDFVQWRNQLEGGFAVLSITRDGRDVRIARDRFGAVPVYWSRQESSIVISTRARCVEALSPPSSPDADALLESVRFRWLAGTKTLRSGITQIGAGDELQWEAGQEGLRSNTWFKMAFSPSGSLDIHEQTQKLRFGLSRAVASMLADADCPAILLSGGVDSSVVAALAREVRPDVRCFIARVEGADGVEELRRARFVASHLGLKLHEIDVVPTRFATDLRRIVNLLEEPSRNPNNLILVQLYDAMRREGIDRVLNGDGAEMILGLADTVRVSQFAKKAQLTDHMPSDLRRWAAQWLRRSDRSLAWRLASVLDISRREYAGSLDEIDYSPVIRRALRSWMGVVDPAIRGCPADVLFDGAEDQAKFDDALHSFGCATTLLSSQRRHECIARDFGIEAATPFTHTEVLRFAQELPRELRFTTRSRPVLKNLCDILVYPEVANWPKLGFSVPSDQWLDGPLEPLLSEVMLDDTLLNVLPDGLRNLTHSTTDPEWRWTLLTLHLALER